MPKRGTEYLQKFQNDNDKLRLFILLNWIHEEKVRIDENW